MRRFVHLVTMLSVIAIPAAGWFIGQWSGGTTLAVYWFENVAMSTFIVAQIRIHQRWNPRRGHFRYRAPSANRASSPMSFAKSFAVTSLTFSAAHGVFLGAMLFLLDRNGESALASVDWRSVAFGCLSVFCFLAVDFVVDLLTLRQRTFAEMEQTANRAFQRVVVVHLTLILGLFGVAVTGAPAAFFGVFVALKTLLALSVVLPQWDPAEAPVWLSRVMNKVPNVQRGRSFEEHWAKDREDENRRRAGNEEPWEGALP